MLHFCLKLLDGNDRVVGFCALDWRSLFDRNVYIWVKNARTVDNGSHTVGFFWHRDQREQIIRVLKAGGYISD